MNDEQRTPTAYAERIPAPNDYNGMKPVGFTEWLAFWKTNRTRVDQMFAARDRSPSESTENRIRSAANIANVKLTKQSVWFYAMAFGLLDPAFLKSRARKHVEKQSGMTYAQMQEWTGIEPRDNPWDALAQTVVNLCDQAKQQQNELEQTTTVLEEIAAVIARNVTVTKEEIDDGETK